MLGFYLSFIVTTALFNLLWKVNLKIAIKINIHNYGIFNKTVGLEFVITSSGGVFTFKGAFWIFAYKFLMTGALRPSTV